MKNIPGMEPEMGPGMEPRRDDVAWAFVDALHAASRGLRRDGAATGSSGVPPGQLRLLRVLSRARGPLRAVELAAALDIAPRSVTTKVDQAEEDGFVRRLADPHDRRARLVELTGTGHEALARASLERRRGAAERLRRLSAGERAELVRLLRVVAADDADDIEA